MPNVQLVFRLVPNELSWALEQVFKAELKEGDAIVMGSDGLFDNVFDRDIESTLSIFGGTDAEAAERCGKLMNRSNCCILLRRSSIAYVTHSSIINFTLKHPR